MKMKKRICMLALAGVMAVSALNLGYAAWKTDITATGSVTANGKWNVRVTAADMEVSNGATATLDYSSYQLIQNEAITKNQMSNLALEIANNKASLKSNVGKELAKYKQNAMSGWVWLVDTTRFDLSQLGTLESEPRRLLMLDGMEKGYIIRVYEDNTAPDGTVVPRMNGWYGANTTIGSSSFLDIKDETAKSVTEQLVAKSDAVIKQLRPDTYQDYTLVLVRSDYSNQFVIASMGNADGTEVSPTTYTDTEVTYADVTFGLPGAWAKYTFTVTNDGTANANLTNITCELETNPEETDQLVLDAPELEGEVLKPGESCTLTYVVKVPADYEETELNATGTLNIKLPYSQDGVDDAPTAGHTHG